VIPPLADPLRLRFAQIRSSPASCRPRRNLFLRTCNALLRSQISSSARSRSSRAFFARNLCPHRLFSTENACSLRRISAQTKNTNHRSDPKPYRKYVTLEPTLVRHSKLHRNRSIAPRSAQCRLTAIPFDAFMALSNAQADLEEFFSAFFRTHAAEFFQPSPMDVGNDAKLSGNFAPVLGPTPGIGLDQCRLVPLPAQLRWWNVTANMWSHREYVE